MSPARVVVVAALVGVGLTATAGVVPFVADLPEVVAIHWEPGGEPDGHGPRALLAVIGVGIGLFGLAGVAAGRRADGDPDAARVAASVAIGAPMLGLAVSATTTWANAGVADWRDARDLPVGAVVLGIVAALCATTVAVFRSLPAGDRRAASPDSGAGPVTFVGTARNPVLLVTAAVFGVAALASAAAGSPLMALVFVPTAIAVALFGRVTVFVAGGAIEVRYGGLTWPRTTLGLDTVESVDVLEHLRPMQWGGWGYRGSRGLMKRAAVVVRSGEAIALGLTGGRRFAITVDDAPAAAAAVRSNLSRP